MFRKVSSLPLSVLLMELGIKGFTGYLSLAGECLDGFLTADLSFMEGEVVSCRASLNGEDISGKCIKAIESAFCVNCFAEAMEGEPKAELEMPVKLISSEVRVSPAIGEVSRDLCRKENLLEILKTSKTAALVKASPTKLLKALTSGAGIHALIMSISLRDWRAMILAHNYEVVGACLITRETQLVGEEALNETLSMKKEAPAIISFIDIAKLKIRETET